MERNIQHRNKINQEKIDTTLLNRNIRKFNLFLIKEKYKLLIQEILLKINKDPNSVRNDIDRIN